ncbi:hypothetical protein LAD77_01480 [Klebsiella pneumoniae]|nr:hypothetical protein [Klebsiella pneumoniae]
MKKHVQHLQSAAGAFFSVNLCARNPKAHAPQTNKLYAVSFLLELPPLAAAELRGIYAARAALPRYSWYIGLMIRLIMKSIVRPG